jgi:hypothetical protein
MALNVESLLKRIPADERVKLLRGLLTDRDVPDGQGGVRQLQGLQSRFVNLLSDVEATDAMVEAMGRKIQSLGDGPDSEVLRKSLEAQLIEQVVLAERLRATLEAVGTELEKVYNRLDELRGAGTS